jgi:uncharacterized protein
MPNPVVHFEISSKNAKTAQDFYSTIFGWKIDSNNPIGYGLVEAGSSRGIGGGIAQADEQTLTPVTIYIEVDNPEEYLDKIVKQGGKVVRPVTQIPGMVTFALFGDPDGNIIGLVKSEVAGE